MTTPTDAGKILAATTFTTLPKDSRVFVADRLDADLTGEHAVSNAWSYASAQKAARVSADGRFILLKTYGTGYQLAVAISETPEIVQRNAYGYQLVSSTLYRKLPKMWSTRGGRYGTSLKLADVVEEAKEITAQLALVEDCFRLELPVEQEYAYELLVATRIAEAKAYTGRRYYGGYGQSLPATALVESSSHPFASQLLHRAVTGAVRAAVDPEQGQYPDEVGVSVVFVGERVDTAELVEQAHAEAIDMVVAARADRDQGIATLRARRLELESELRTALEVSLEQAKLKVERATELAKLALHSVDDAAQQILDGGGQSFLGSSRAPYRIAEEIAATDSELELAEGDVVANTVLQTNTELVRALLA